MNKHWEKKKLGEVIKLEYGKPLPDSKRKTDGAYPVYGANGEKDRTDEYYHDKQSIIVGRKGSAGEINLTEKRFWPLDVTYYVTYDDKKYDLNFIYHLLGNLALPKLAKGVKPGINRNEVYAIDICIPQLSEQKRIVTILNEVFAAIATAKANAEKNLQNAKELFESYLQSLFANPDDGWEKKKLGDACEVFADGDWVESKDQSPEGIRLIQTGNVGQGIFKDRGEKARYISEATFKRLRCTEIFEGDCLISRLPDPVGRSCLLPDTGERMITAVDCTIVRFNPKQLIPEFFNFFSQSFDYLKTVEAETTGTTRKRISRSKLGQVEIPLPPLPEQRSIVAKLDALSTETQCLEAIYQQKLADLEELKRSVLQKAFNSELAGAQS
jgi:type I restriction enzyme S subunit